VRQRVLRRLHVCGEGKERGVRKEMKTRKKYRIRSKNAEKKKGTRNAKMMKAKGDGNGLLISRSKKVMYENVHVKDKRRSHKIRQFKKKKKLVKRSHSERSRAHTHTL
jgi:hypothetical protein